MNAASVQRLDELAVAYRSAVLAKHAAPFDTLPGRLAAARTLPVVADYITATREEPIAMKVYATIPAGSVEYAKDEAEVSIDELIEQLEQAREDGATHVLGLSGNYRGASYVRLGKVQIDDEDGDL